MVVLTSSYEERTSTVSIFFSKEYMLTQVLVGAVCFFFTYTFQAPVSGPLLIVVMDDTEVILAAISSVI